MFEGTLPVLGGIRPSRVLGFERHDAVLQRRVSHQDTVQWLLPTNVRLETVMTIIKEHLEFHEPDMATGWHSPAGYSPGIKQKILTGFLDETAKRGHRTRLLRFEPGEFTTVTFVHDYWEEVWLVSGDLIVGNDADGRGGTPYVKAAYACRPPGAHHGPFKSETGCLLMEIHYYDETTASPFAAVA